MTIQEAYIKMQDECGIEVGDTVKILRKAKSLEMGWSCDWVGSMDKYVGECGIVMCVLCEEGIDVSVDGDCWYFPFFVLELIKEKEIREVTMAEVYDKFGCKVKIKEQ